MYNLQKFIACYMKDTSKTVEYNLAQLYVNFRVGFDLDENKRALIWYRFESKKINQNLTS